MKKPHRGPKPTPATETKARKLFWGSFFLSLLILTHLFFLAQRAGGVLAAIRTTALPAVLLWSIVVTGYSFYVMQDIASQRGKQIGASFIDSATGVFTLDYLKSCLENERRRVEEIQAGSAIVAYVDMVNLERVNRAFGHAIGDIVLKGLAQQIAGSTRRGDVVGRVGGDEFLIVMPETRPDEAQEVVNAIEEAVKSYRLDLGKKGKIDFVECHVGLAVFPDEGEVPEEVIAAARGRLPKAIAAVRQAAKAPSQQA